MKLAFCLFKYYPFGGLERSFLSILKEAVSRGHNVVVYTMSWDGERHGDFQLEVLPAKGFSNHKKCAHFVELLGQRLSQHNYDLVVGFNRMPLLDVYYCGDVSFIAKAEKSHGWLYKQSSRYKIFSAFEKAVFSADSSTHIMSISDLAITDYCQVHATDKSRIHALPPGIDKPSIDKSLASDARLRIRKELNISDSDFLLLMIGSDYKRKGLDRSISALAAAKGSLSGKVKLLVIGDGDIEKYRGIAQAAGVAGDVVFLGPRSDRFDYLAAADVVLHPALTETAGNVILEGLIASKPVLVTAGCGFSVHIEKSGAGFVIPDSPYEQPVFNKLLVSALDNDNIVAWQQWAQQYTASEDLYSRPQTAIDIVENTAQLKLEKLASQKG